MCGVLPRYGALIAGDSHGQRADGLAATEARVSNARAAAAPGDMTSANAKIVRTIWASYTVRGGGVPIRMMHSSASLAG